MIELQFRRATEEDARKGAIVAIAFDGVSVTGSQRFPVVLQYRDNDIERATPWKDVEIAT